MINTRFIPIAVFCLLPALSFSNTAQAKNLSQTYEINRAKVEDESINGIAFINLEGKVNVSSILQEPLVGCNTRWSFSQTFVSGQPSITIDGYTIADIPQEVLDKVTLRSVILSFAVPPLNDAMFSENTWYELSCDPGALEPVDSEKYSFTVPGSPAWDKTFHVRDTYDGFDKEAATFADEATAKQTMIKLLDESFLTDFDSAKMLRARINLSPVKQWLDKQKKDAEDKLKQAEEKAKEENKDASEEDDFWSGDKKDKKETAKSESVDDNFWSGEEQNKEQVANKGEDDFWAGEESSKSGDDDFWSGDTEKVRDERLAEKQAKETKRQTATSPGSKAPDGIQFDCEDEVLSPDGSRIAIAEANIENSKYHNSSYYDVVIRDAKNKSEILKSPYSIRRGIRCIAWSPDGNRLAALSSDGRKLSVFDAKTGQFISNSSNHSRSNDMLSIAWSSDSKHIVTGHERGAIITDLSDSNFHRITGPGGDLRYVSHVAWSPDGKYIITAKKDIMFIWDANGILPLSGYSYDKDSPLYTIDGVYITGVAWFPDSKRFATKGSDETQIWDIANGQLIETIRPGLEKEPEPEESIIYETEFKLQSR